MRPSCAVCPVASVFTNTSLSSILSLTAWPWSGLRADGLTASSNVSGLCLAKALNLSLECSRFPSEDVLSSLYSDARSRDRRDARKGSGVTLIVADSAVPELRQYGLGGFFEESEE
jgi:hypothetical protein